MPSGAYTKTPFIEHKTRCPPERSAQLQQQTTWRRGTLSCNSKDRLKTSDVTIFSSVLKDGEMMRGAMMKLGVVKLDPSAPALARVASF